MKDKTAPNRKGFGRKPLGFLHIVTTLTFAIAAIALISWLWMRTTEPELLAQAFPGAGRGPSPREIVPAFNLNDCNIPRDEIFGGGPGKDGIPALTDPEYETADQAEGWMRDEDRVIGIAFGGEAAAYPLRILNWHEAVNDVIGGQPVVVTYCPLCDSALVFDRDVNGDMLEFGISGLLYNSNVLLYDRQTDADQESLWSQGRMEAVCGPRKGTVLELLPAELATWEDWWADHPQTRVLSRETGHARDYSQNPYSGYLAGDNLMFPADFDRARLGGLRAKDRVLMVQAGDVHRAYPIPVLEREGPVTGTLGDTRIRVTLQDAGAETAGVEVLEAPAGVQVASAGLFLFTYLAMFPEGEVHGVTPNDTERASATQPSTRPATQPASP